ncbi:MAG: MgtC/SapB family protein [Candidatus Bathyarchaeia archaeon]
MILEEIIHLFLAAALGLVIGFEREKSHKPAGLRTHMLVCLESCFFTSTSLKFGMDPARIASGIAAGIGDYFLKHSSKRVFPRGLTFRCTLR